MKTLTDLTGLPPGLALVEFWASWCLPCQASCVMLQALSQDYWVGRINADQCAGETGRWEIMGLPTFLFFWDGQEIARLVGAQSTGMIVEMLEEIQCCHSSV